VEVVVKFIRKSKVFTESWVDTEDGRRLPSEVSMLLILNHPNIVKVVLTPLLWIYWLSVVAGIITDYSHTVLNIGPGSQSFPDHKQGKK